MTDTRPRPEYGEYATPEEQAEAMGGVLPVVETPAPVVDVVAPPVVAEKQPRRWDLVTTIALIIFGIYTTISGFATYSDLAYSLGQVYALYGYDGQYPNAEQAASVGLVINIVQPVLLIVTIWLSTVWLRKGRVTFWIPLTAGLVSGITSSALLMTLLFADPGFVAFMMTSLGS